MKYDDAYGTLYTCPRAKILAVGRIRVGEKYTVQYGNTTSAPETATVMDTGDYMTMKKKQRELEETHSTPDRSPVPVPSPEYKIRKRKHNLDKPTTQKKPRQEAKKLRIGEGNSDPFILRSTTPSPELSPHLLPPSPEDLSDTSPDTRLPTSTNTTETQTTPTHKEPTAFSLQQTLQCIHTQLQISNTRLSEMERIIATQQSQINWLVSNQKIALTQPSTPTRLQRLHVPPTPQRLVDSLPATPTGRPNQTPSLPDPISTVPDSPHTPTTFSRLPMHLFNDIPASSCLTEDDLNRYLCSAKTPGALAILLKHFPEVFTPDQLRVYYSYRGGGKLSRKPLDNTRKDFIRRYVTAFYLSMGRRNSLLRHGN